jgi:oxalate decarboxylase/phosphoglucose isomerase-like protein (cupin superfamily)
MRRTEVLHSELQKHLPSELGKLSDMLTGEQHIIHIKDEEDGTPIGCVLTGEAMVLIRPKKAD